MGQLVSVRAQVAKINVKVNVSQGALNLCAYSVNHAVQGTIEAGVDFTQIDADSVHFNAPSETYHLTVPAAQLTSCRIDSIQQYSWSVSVCNPDFDTARQLATYMALTQFRDDAVEGGILTNAKSHANELISNFVSVLTGHPVVFDSGQPETTPLPSSSCNPEPPAGWVHDPTTDVWNKIN